jgi:hypothetical protein
MISIGIRATPKEIFYCIAENKDDEISIIDVSSVKVPLALYMPEKLKYIRNTFFDIIEHYKVTTAGIRVAESNAQKINIERTYFEGVLQEMLSSSCIEKYYVGNIASISSKLGLKNDKTLKEKYIEGTEVFRNIDNWGSYKKEEREAIMVCFGGFNI